MASCHRDQREDDDDDGLSDCEPHRILAFTRLVDHCPQRAMVTSATTDRDRDRFGMSGRRRRDTRSESDDSFGTDIS